MTAGQRPRRAWLAPPLDVTAVVVLAAALRFFALGQRSFWRDEAMTVRLVRTGFRNMLSTIPDSEGTPPLYYLVAWVWTHLLGSSEAGLRSLSALVGTGTVVVVYLIGGELASRRVALAAALLAAVNPFLVWQAQDGRAYALYTFLGAVSFLACVRTLRSPTTVGLAVWAVASALALSTHYFAAFLVAPEAILLLVAPSRRVAKVVAVAAVGLAGLALLPLALFQRSHASVAWIAEIPHSNRAREMFREFLVGPQPPARTVVVVLSAICVLVALWLLVRRGSRTEQRAALLAGGTGVTALALAFAVSIVGPDYFLSRNLVVTWVPFAVTVAAGLAGRRSGVLGAASLATLCVIGTTVVVASAGDPKFRAEDWRGAAHALGPAGAPRGVVLWLGAGEEAFEIYRPTSRPLPHAGVAVREVDVVFVGASGDAVDRRLGDLAPGRPFRKIQRIERRHFTVVRYRADRPTRVRRASFLSGPAGYSAAVLLDQR